MGLGLGIESLGGSLGTSSWAFVRVPVGFLLGCRTPEGLTLNAKASFFFCCLRCWVWGSLLLSFPC